MVGTAILIYFYEMQFDAAAYIACEQAGFIGLGLGRDSRVGAGRAESGLVRRECSGEPVDIPLMPLFHDTSSWYQDLIG